MAKRKWEGRTCYVATNFSVFWRLSVIMLWRFYEVLVGFLLSMLIGLMTERQNVWQKRKSSLGSCLKTSNHCNCNSKNPNAKRLLLAYDKSVAHSAKIVTHGSQPEGKRVCWLEGTTAHPREANRAQRTGGRVLEERKPQYGEMNLFNC